MTILDVYNSTHGKQTLNLKMEELNGNIIITGKGTKQYVLVMFYDYKTGYLKHKYVLYIDQVIPGSNPPVLSGKLPHIPAKSGFDYKLSMTYIFAITDKASADVFCSIVPPSRNPSTKKSHVSLGSHNDLTILRTDRSMGVSNKSKNTLYLDRIKLLPGKTMTLNKTDIYTVSIKTQLGVDGLSYSQLDYSEKETYIPLCVTQGVTQINYMAAQHKWVKAADHLYKGTLTYVPTRDKEFHFINEDGIKYKFNTDSIRSLLPHMVKGVVNGRFKYVARGSRTVKYGMELHHDATISGEFIICDSDSSDED